MRFLIIYDFKPESVKILFFFVKNIDSHVQSRYLLTVELKYNMFLLQHNGNFSRNLVYPYNVGVTWQ